MTGTRRGRDEAQADKSHALVPGTRGKAVLKTVHASPGPHSTATATCAEAFAASPPSSASRGGESPKIDSVQILGIRWCYGIVDRNPWSPKQSRPETELRLPCRSREPGYLALQKQRENRWSFWRWRRSACMRIGSSSDWHGDRNSRGLRAFTGRQPLAHSLRGTCAVGGMRYGRTT